MQQLRRGATCAWTRRVASQDGAQLGRRLHGNRFDRGDVDLRRFAARHHHTWGIIVRQTNGRPIQRYRAGIGKGCSLDPHRKGQIVRGVAHVDVELADELAFRDFKMINSRGDPADARSE